ncbi:MAG TPA: PilT/PilU family type 4a pilus ATPase [Candidatus Eremiobacteraeota bacterium]|nr:PilT/PilU family type 4a pilus ATPase [Candidatus Eremiobacteraeota bacterium]
MNLEELLQLMVKRGASDMYLAVGSPSTFRIDGRLTPVSKDLLRPQDTQILLEPLLSDVQKMTLLKDKEFDTAYSVRGLSRFRINIFFQRGTLGASIRIMPPKPLSLEELGVPPQLKKCLALSSGFVIIAGPAGSGKTTTLASMIDFINEHRSCLIISIEDPIEFVHRNKQSIICQREVGSDTLSILSALNSVLRQAPDVIAVSDLKNEQVIEECIALASSGMLVLAIIRMSGVVQSINHIIDVFPEEKRDKIRALLSSCLQGIFSQTLVARSKARGRVVATEFMIPPGSAKAKRAIREGELLVIGKLMEKESDMKTQAAALKDLFSRKIISREEALANAYDPAELERIIDRAY